MKAALWIVGGTVLGWVFAVIGLEVALETEFIKLEPVSF